MYTSLLGHAPTRRGLRRIVSVDCIRKVLRSACCECGVAWTEIDSLKWIQRVSGTLCVIYLDNGCHDEGEGWTVWTVSPSSLISTNVEKFVRTRRAVLLVIRCCRNACSAMIWSGGGEVVSERSLHALD